jgi:hypothetical protein
MGGMMSQYDTLPNTKKRPRKKSFFIVILIYYKTVLFFLNLYFMRLNFLSLATSPAENRSTNNSCHKTVTCPSLLQLSPRSLFVDNKGNQECPRQCLPTPLLFPAHMDGNPPMLVFPGIVHGDF